MGGAVRQHHHLGGAGDHVDAHGAEDATLRGRHIGVARADDLGHGADRLGAVGQRRDRLRPPDAIDLVDAGERRRRQHQRVQDAVGGRHHDDDALAARDLGRQGIHQHGGRVGGGAARHVEADRADRAPAPAELDAERVGPELVGGLLPLVEGQDAVAGERQGVEGPLRHPGGRGRDLPRADAQAARSQVDAVEAGREVEQRRVAARRDVRDDGCGRVVDVPRHFPLGRQEGREAPFEIARPGVEPRETLHRR